MATDQNNHSNWEQFWDSVRKPLFKKKKGRGEGNKRKWVDKILFQAY